MAGLALIAFILYFGKVLSVPKNCSLADTCLPVNADVCDNRKCLLVNRSEVDEFTSRGMKPYEWNIGWLPYISSCGYKYQHETTSFNDGTVTTDLVYTVTSGPSCNETSSFKYPTEPIVTDEPYTLSKLVMSNALFHECYLYYEPGVAVVMRDCLIYPSYQYGQACAQIYADVSSDVYGKTGQLDEFLKGFGVNFTRIVTDCV